MTSLDVDGGMGRVVIVRHFSRLSSMKLMFSLHTIPAAASLVNLGLFLNPSDS